ncbi:hypothetical protein [Streptomyces sp. NPDC056105]|uniref:hypothetical protein n=1 Tax=Streptomyces sp. NPDC056105 TaxID=3345714 RepID=UPI0035DE2637
MRRMRMVGSILLAVLVVGGAAGCSGDDPGGGKDGEPSVSASKAKPVAPRDALEDYTAAGAAGCETAPECQDQVTAQLKAAARMRAAMKAKDPALYAVPIGFVDEAERQADHFGRDNLGAKGNSLAVTLPLQRMTSWFAEHPEG